MLEVGASVFVSYDVQVGQELLHEKLFATKARAAGVYSIVSPNHDEYIEELTMLNDNLLRMVPS